MSWYDIKPLTKEAAPRKNKIEPKIEDLMYLHNKGHLHAYDVAVNGTYGAKNTVTHDQFMNASRISRYGTSYGIGSKTYIGHYTDAVYAGATDKEINEGDSLYGIGRYSRARSAGLKHNDALFALRKRYNVSDYSKAVKAGVSQDEYKDVINLRKKYPKISKYTFLHNYIDYRNNNFDHDESLEATKSDIPPSYFKSALEAGATKNQVYEAKANNKNIGTYATLRKAMSHSHAMSLDNDTGLSYAKAINGGATKNEIDDAVSKGIDASTYANLRSKLRVQNWWADQNPLYVKPRASHSEVLDALNNSNDFNSYTLARTTGANHQEAMDFAKLGVDPDEYKQMASNDGTYQGFMDARSHGIDASSYGSALARTQNWLTHNQRHQKAMQSLLGVSDYDLPESMKKQSNKNYDDSWTINDFIIIASNIFIAEKPSKTVQEALIVSRNGKADEYFQARRNGISHNQFMEAYHDPRLQGAKKDRSWGEQYGIDHITRRLSDYVHGSTYASHQQMMDVLDQGFKLKGYGSARAAGIGHAQTLKLLNSKIPITLYSDAFQAGATHNEILDARKNKINLGKYSELRRTGFNHKESLSLAPMPWVQPSNYYGWPKDTVRDKYKDILDAAKRGIDSSEYVVGLENGISHDKIIAMHNQGINIHGYTNSIGSGATEDQVMEAHNNGIDLLDYANARRSYKSAPTHDQIMEAHSKGIEPNHLKDAMLYSTYDNVIDAHNHGIDIDDYAKALEYRIPHDELLEAHENGAKLQDYAHARSQGKDVESALLQSSDTYNPYNKWFFSMKWYD